MLEPMVVVVGSAVNIVLVDTVDDGFSFPLPIKYLTKSFQRNQ